MGNITSLGGLLPLVNQTLSGLNTVDRAIARFGGDRNDARDQNRLAVQQLAERNRNDEAALAERTARDQAILTAQNNESERRRQTALKRAVARQRASFGGAGIEDEESGGSGQAVLLGLYQDGEQERLADQGIYQLRQQILADNLGNLKRRNLLAESQLVARRR